MELYVSCHMQFPDDMWSVLQAKLTAIGDIQAEYCLCKREPLERNLLKGTNVEKKLALALLTAAS